MCAEAVKQSLTGRTRQRRDLGEGVGDHATARGDHDAAFAVPGAALLRIDDAADRLRELIGNTFVRARGGDGATTQYRNLHGAGAAAQLNRMRRSVKTTQVATGVDDRLAAAAAS